MSFHSDLVATACLPTDLVTAGVISSTAQAYAGRRSQKVKRQDREVWIERLAVTGAEDKGLHAITRHAYRLHVRQVQNAGGNQAGNEQLTTVEAHLRTLADRYRGTRPFASLHGTTMANLVCSDATESSVDVDQDDELVLDGALDVAFVVKG